MRLTMLMLLSLPAFAGPVYVFRDTVSPVLADLTPAPARDGWFAAGDGPFSEPSQPEAVVYGLERRESLLTFNTSGGDGGHGHPEPPKTPETSTAIMVLTGIAGVWLGTRRKTA